MVLVRFEVKLVKIDFIDIVWSTYDENEIEIMFPHNSG